LKRRIQRRIHNEDNKRRRLSFETAVIEAVYLLHIAAGRRQPFVSQGGVR
jgi:hypothetical protein